MAGGAGVAVALPATAATTAAVTTAPTVSAYTIPGSSTTDALAITPVTAEVPTGQPPDQTLSSMPEEWIIDSASGGPNLLEVSSIPSAPSQVEPQGLGYDYDGVTASVSDSGNSLIDVGDEAVGVADHELYGIPTGSEADSEEVSDGGQGDVDDHAGVGMTEGGGDATQYVFTSDGTPTADACSTEGSGCTELTLPSSWAAGVDGLAGDPDAAVLFSDSNDELGELGTDGTPDGPWDTGHVSSLPDAIATSVPPLIPDPTNPAVFTSPDPDTWFAWESTAEGTPDELAFVDDTDPGAAPTVYGPAEGMPLNADITAVAVTPDGNIMFCDAANNAIGELDASTGTITETPLPSGFTLASNDGAIEPGPADDTAYFDAQSGSGLAVGEVQGDAGEVTGAPAPPVAMTPTTTTDTTTTDTTTSVTATTASTTTTAPAVPPVAASTTTSAAPGSTPTFSPPGTDVKAVAGQLKLAGTATVSKAGYAALKLSCSTGNCIGRLLLTVTKRERVKGKRRAIKSVTVTYASLSYRLAQGTAAIAELKLSAAGRSAVAAAQHRRLAVTVTIATATGTARHQLTLVGAQPVGASIIDSRLSGAVDHRAAAYP